MESPITVMPPSVRASPFCMATGAGPPNPGPSSEVLLRPKLCLQRRIVHVLLRVDRTLYQNVLQFLPRCKPGQILDGFLTHSLDVKQRIRIEVLAAKQLEPDWKDIHADQIHVVGIGEGPPFVGV